MKEATPDSSGYRFPVVGQQLLASLSAVRGIEKMLGKSCGEAFINCLTPWHIQTE